MKPVGNTIEEECKRSENHGNVFCSNRNRLCSVGKKFDVIFDAHISTLLLSRWILDREGPASATIGAQTVSTVCFLTASCNTNCNNLTINAEQ